MYEVDVAGTNTLMVILFKVGFLLGKVGITKGKENAGNAGLAGKEVGWEETPRPTFPLSQRLPFLQVVDYSLESLDSSRLLSMIYLESRFINIYLHYQPRLTS